MQRYHATNCTSAVNNSAVGGSLGRDTSRAESSALPANFQSNRRPSQLAPYKLKCEKDPLNSRLPPPDFHPPTTNCPEETLTKDYVLAGYRETVEGLEESREISLSQISTFTKPVILKCKEAIRKYHRAINESRAKKRKSLPNLKTLNLHESKNLMKTPDFEGLPCLERLILSECNRLEEIHPSIGYHKRLVFVDMRWCSALKMFPPIIHMKKLETLDLEGCQKLQQFPDIQSNMDSLVTLDLSHTGIEIIPPSDGRLPGLKFLNLSNCWNLVELPDLPSSIAILKADGCDSLEIVRDLSDYKWLWKVSLLDCYELIGGERVLHSMLEGNAAKDRFMSVLLPAVEPSPRIFTRLVTLQLPTTGTVTLVDFYYSYVLLLMMMRIGLVIT